MKKTVIINRGVSGSGKSTLTKKIYEKCNKENIKVHIHSTDNFFMKDGEYIFDSKKLGIYHNKNLQNFKKSLEENIDVVICDNTNIAPWQSEPYTKISREFKYQIIIVTFDPRDIKEHKKTEKNIDEEILNEMIKEYYLYDDLLNPRIVIDEKKHINYIWDIESNQKIANGVAKHFDCDKVIRVIPDDFLQNQNYIIEKIVKLIKTS